MSKLISALFPEGQRKVMVNLVILAIGIALDKLGGGLTDQMQNFLLVVAGIFTGGNVATHIIPALIDILRGSKVGQVIEDIIPGDQGLGTVVAKAEAAVEAADAAHEKIDAESARIADLEKKLAVQAQNMGQVVQILNSLRGQPGGPAKPPGA